MGRILLEKEALTCDDWHIQGSSEFIFILVGESRLLGQQNEIIFRNIPTIVYLE